MIYEFKNLFIKSSIWLWIFYILCKKRTVLELGVGDGLLLHFLSRNCWVFCFLPFYAQNGTANIGYSSREMQTLIFHQTESVQVLVCWKIYTLYGFSFYNPSYLILMLILLYSTCLLVSPSTFNEHNSCNVLILHLIIGLTFQLMSLSACFLYMPGWKASDLGVVVELIPLGFAFLV